MVRSENQDFFGRFPEDVVDVSEKDALFIIADGMGGHNAGREASELAVNTLSEAYFSRPESDPISDRIHVAFDSANEYIYNYSINNPQNAGMGTTCTALVLKKDKAFIGHIGDSRVYKITRGKIEQLTKDHSKVAEMVRRGLLTKEEAKIHPERSHLYRALGTKAEIEIDMLENIGLEGDITFLMCTDGLFNHVDDEEMKKAVLTHPPDDACRKLIALANERGGQDNITVQVIRVKGKTGFFRRLFRRG